MKTDDVDGVVKDLPGPRRLAEELVGGELRELTLVDDVRGREQRAAQRLVQSVGLVAGPARVRDAVLVHNDGRAAAPRGP